MEPQYVFACGNFVLTHPESITFFFVFTVSLEFGHVYVSLCCGLNEKSHNQLY